MYLRQDLSPYINRPVGVALKNGQGVTGVLCGFDNDKIYLLQYLYHTQFATMQYAYSDILNVLPYPSCQAPRIPYY